MTPTTTTHPIVAFQRFEVEVDTPTQTFIDRRYQSLESIDSMLAGKSAGVPSRLGEIGQFHASVSLE